MILAGVVALYGIVGARDAAAEPVPIPGALLMKADRVEVDATAMIESATGSRALLLGTSGATLLGQDGDPVVRVQVSGLKLGDVSSGDRFVLVHDGGITLHQAGRELGRLGAVGAVLDLAISPDGRYLALATTVALSLYDSVDGRTLWSIDGECTRVAYDAKGKLFAERKGTVKQYDGASGSPAKGSATLPEPPGLLPDGCLVLSDGRFCPSGEGGTGLQRPDGTMWILREGVLEQWRPLPADKIVAVGADVSGAKTVAWAGLDLLVALSDGTLERRATGGALLASPHIPDCLGCVPLLVGAEMDGSFYAVAASGAWQRWAADGTAIGAPGRGNGPLDVARLPDGRWFSVDDEGRPRVGKQPGTGKPLKKVSGAVGVDAAGNTLAVWSTSGVWVYSARGDLLSSPELGPDRRALSVALSSDGTTVAVLDDKGTLHAYRTGDGRAVFRVNSDIEGRQLAWAPGRGYLLAGGDPLRVFGASDGKEVARIELAPDGVITALAVAEDGSLAVLHTTRSGTQLVRRIDWATVSQ
jgi:WD40 repeat protein